MALLARLYDLSKTPAYQHYLRYTSLLSKARSLHDSLSDQDEKDHAFFDQIEHFVRDLIPMASSMVAKYQKDVDALDASFKSQTDIIDKDNKLFEFYKEALDRLTKQYLVSLSDMLTEVYSSVYDQTNKRIWLGMEDFRNKKVIRLYLINNIGGKDYKEDFDKSGGSAQIVLGTIVAIYFILTTGMPRIIFFDESLSALHTNVLHRFMDVLQNFVTDLDFKFVIVEHAALRLKDYINKIYWVRDGEYTEIVGDAIPEFMAQIEKDAV
jgi:hypothetical protein